MGNLRDHRASWMLLHCAALLLSAVTWAESADEKEPDGASVTVLFVGGAAGDDASPILKNLAARLASLDPKQTTVVFTGNYGEGELPAEGAPGRAKAENHLLAHVNATRAFVARGGKVYYLAGPLDFGPGGTTAVRRMRTFLNRSYAPAVAALDSDATREPSERDVMPHAGCGDTTLLKLGKGIGLLLVDSQWWMQKWADDPFANAGCTVQTRAEFQGDLEEALKAYRHDRLIVASHHPIRSYGELGGAFTAKAHLSPAPVLGTLWVLARQAGLVEQYQNHPMVRSYTDLLFEESQRYGSYVFASGHDASLQYLQFGKQAQIISGTSSREARPTTSAGKGDFAASTPGWAEVTLAATGEGEVALKAGRSEQDVIFTAALPKVIMPVPEQPPLPLPTGPIAAPFSNANVFPIAPWVKPLIGSFYTDAYQLRVPWPILDLDTEEGGFEVRGLGGGLQTNSLKLRDAKGGNWVMRAVTKDPSRVLTWPQNQTSLINMMLDEGYAATQPEAALALPRLSEAVGVLHAEPRIFYLPDQEKLGRFRGMFGEELVLLERRPNTPEEGDVPESLVGAPSPAGKTRIRTTEETVEKMIENPATYQVDQEDMLRARLLDMFVSDWDRADGQWRFAGIPNADGTETSRPVARDRDQALSNYNGFGLALIRLALPLARVSRPFDGSYGSVAWLNYSARNVDPVLLNRVPHDRWLEIAKEVQASLTDAVIDEALATWHPETYALDGERTAKALKARRDGLVTAADKYFSVLNRNVDVLGSNQDDQFDIWFEKDGAVRVAVQLKEKGGVDPPPYFDRVFHPNETGELRLYALDGNDTLRVHGDVPTSICVRFVGGPGDDSVVAAPGGSGPLNARAIRVYDANDGATIDPSVAVRDERSNSAQLNEYDRFENHDPGYGTILPSLNINPDDGLWLGASYRYIVPGYKKHPFASEHDITGTFATATLGATLDYFGLFPETLGPLDQQLHLMVRSPTYARNFYGITNEYVPNVQNADFFRARQAWYEARYGVRAHPGREWTHIGAQVFGQAIVTQDTAGRFVTISSDAASGLGPRYFAGARVFAEVNTFDNSALPTRGFLVHASGEGRFDVRHGDDFSFTYLGRAAFALPFDRQRRFVLVSRAHVEGLVGTAPFYFQPTLGGDDMRAYHYEQLAGTVAFSQTTDLRVDVVRIFSKLPGTLGLTASVDHGRVFGPLATDTYHVDLGGGVWWYLLDVLKLEVGYYHGFDASSRFLLTLAVAEFSHTGFDDTHSHTGFEDTTRMPGIFNH